MEDLFKRKWCPSCIWQNIPERCRRAPLPPFFWIEYNRLWNNCVYWLMWCASPFISPPVALNFQTPCADMDLNQGLFSQNGQSGYVLKPAYLRTTESEFDPITLIRGPWLKHLEFHVMVSMPIPLYTYKISITVWLFLDSVWEIHSRSLWKALFLFASFWCIRWSRHSSYLK